MKKVVLLTLLFVAACDQETNNSQPGKTSVEVTRTAGGDVLYETHCATCHNGTVKKAPHRDMIGLMTPESIVTTMTDGIMKAQAAPLNDQEKQLVAEYLANRAIGETSLAQIPACDGRTALTDLDDSQQNWGIQKENLRAIDIEFAGISTKNIDTLKPRWAIAFPGANRVRSQPAFAMGQIFVGSHGGVVYSLSPDTGCANWSFQAASEVRTAIATDASSEQPMIFFGDVLANAYGVDARTGEMKWRVRVDDHPSATITGSPSLHDDSLYVPVSSLEVSLAVNPEYACCTFQGSVVALDKLTGEQRWKTSTIPEPLAVVGQNPIGTDIIGPSGAVVWNSPAIDTELKQLYVGTGENMSSPANATSDALIAMDLSTGKINWVFQATENDAWNTACDTDTPENCPVEGGPDYDFGGAALVVNTTTHGRLVVAGQKSGFVHALNPVTGELVWQTRVGRGGIQGGIHFGIAASGETILVPVSDMTDGRSYPTPDRPGMHAVDANTGEILWSVVHEDQCNGKEFCHPGISQVATVIGDTVIGGAMDGTARGYHIETGEVVWQFDTIQPIPSNSGIEAIGGSLGGAAGPVAKDGLLLLSSGYGIYLHMPGNSLIALETTSSPD